MGGSSQAIVRNAVQIASVGCSELHRGVVFGFGTHKEDRDWEEPLKFLGEVLRGLPEITRAKHDQL